MGGEYRYGVNGAEKDLKMKNAMAVWKELRKKIEEKNVFLFLDYDGTLTPIVEAPQKAKLPVQTRKVLKRLALVSGVKLAVISGRKIADIKKQVGLCGIIYAGNHGLEIEAPGLKFQTAVSRHTKAALKNIGEDLKCKLSDVKAVFMEDKGLTLSVHYRLVKKDSVINKLKSILENVLEPYLAAGKIKVGMGKKVIEIKPALEWNKGKAVEWLLKKSRVRRRGNQTLPIYIGDDSTDEDAFKVLRKKALPIAVGKSGKSLAHYFLNDTGEVISFLKQITEIKQ